MDHHQREVVFQRLKLSKIHLSYRLMDQSPRRVTEQFASLWAPVETLVQCLYPLPTALVRFLAHIPQGHIVLVPKLSRYEPDTRLLFTQELGAIAFISLTDLVEKPLRAFQVVGHLLDHLLGCQGIPQGKWLSDGQGINCFWLEIGQQIPKLFRLGYGIDDIAQANPRNYLARSVAWYLQTHQELNAADPLIEKLLRQTLFSEAFCQRTLPSEG